MKQIKDKSHIIQFYRQAGKTSTTSTDFIPDKDDDFFNFVEQPVAAVEEKNQKIPH